MVLSLSLFVRSIDFENKYLYKLIVISIDCCLKYFLFKLESGGTVLSTNWKDVGAKTLDVKPPDGMEFKKWDS